MAGKRWAELSTTMKITMVALGALQVSLLGATLWDLAHRRPEEIRGDRRIWTAIAFINWIGPLAYFTIGRKDGFSLPPAGRRGRQGKEAGPTDEASPTS